MRKMLPVLLIVLCCVSLGSAAEAVDPATITAAIQKKYQSIKSFEAHFTQRLKNASAQEEEIRKGKILYKHPNLIRWVNETPEQELLLVGKDSVWNFFPEEMIAYKYDAAQVFSSKTILRFISGKADLQDDFAIEYQGSEGNQYRLVLFPKEPEPGLVQAIIWVDTDTYLLKKILVYDFYTNENEVKFDSISLNPDIPDDTFTFTPPQDVEIFDNTQ